MKRASVRFYGELNDFLLSERRAQPIAYEFYVSPAVRDAIESLGVPHTEVELILVNGESVDFAYVIGDGDRISVYPVFESLDVTPLVRVRPQPLRSLSFVADVHLGRLAAYLRTLGFDTLYRNDYTDPELAAISRDSRRVLLTRDVGLLKRAEVTRGYCVRSSVPRLQLEEVLRRFDLARSAQPFRRCLSCNGVLEEVGKEAVRDRVPPGIFERHDEFRHCASCGKVYWQGSHYERMRRLILTVAAHGERLRD